MVIDTSAAAAIIFGEDDAEFYADAILRAGAARMSTLTALELTMVVSGRKGAGGAAEVEAFLRFAQVAMAPFTLEHLELAKAAWLAYGKGRHAAKLNLGDCCSYALAKQTGETLLYKGADFWRTDLNCIRSSNAA